MGEVTLDGMPLGEQLLLLLDPCTPLACDMSLRGLVELCGRILYATFELKSSSDGHSTVQRLPASHGWLQVGWSSHALELEFQAREL